MKKSISVLLTAALLCACSSPSSGGLSPQEEDTVSVVALARPTIITRSFSQYSVSPSVESYTVDPDLGNVLNQSDVSWLSDNAKKQLSEDGFVVTQGWGDEFFEAYEMNSYGYVPSFVTVDSMMHTFHLYYAYLQKNLEKTSLSDKIRLMSKSLLDKSIEQRDALASTEWESAAQRNVDFFSVAVNLIGEETEMSENAKAEYDLIMAAGGIADSPLFTVDAEDPQMMDYSQYIPRGYYTENEQLQRYFRTMMWYGQSNFTQKYEDLDRSALLAVLAMRDGDFTDWEAVYTVTAFFAGESDDNGFYEYYPVLEAVYGKEIKAEELAGDDSKWQKYHAMTGKLGAPKLNSMPVYNETIEPDLEGKITGFRLMGQRFTIDADIMQNLIYRKVKENPSGAQRLLPSGLDVPAALGSDAALSLLEQDGNNEYEGYSENMQALREIYADSDEKVWSASVYALWLKTLRPLLRTYDETFPMFMQSEKWQFKNLMSFLGSYAELKHDSILYAKQVMSEMGGAGFDEIPDDRGYVECEPEVFLHLSELAQFTSEGLQKYGVISPEDVEYLKLFSELASKLQVIAEKELRGELPTDEEFDLIRSYGGTLEHLWLKTMNEGITRAMDCPSPIVADIATDPNGRCLEIATGKPANIYVAVYFDGKVRIAHGTVFSYYEFEQPISQRLTDEQWREKLNDWNNPPAMAEWTNRFVQK